MSIYVHIGPAAIKFGRYWVGFASRNRDSGKRRRTTARALDDARKLERKT